MQSTPESRNLSGSQVFGLVIRLFATLAAFRDPPSSELLRSSLLLKLLSWKRVFPKHKQEERVEWKWNLWQRSRVRRNSVLRRSLRRKARNIDHLKQKGVIPLLFVSCHVQISGFCCIRGFATVILEYYMFHYIGDYLNVWECRASHCLRALYCTKYITVKVSSSSVDQGWPNVSVQTE